MLHYMILALLAWLAGTAIISAAFGGKDDFVKYFLTINAVIVGLVLMGGAATLLVALLAIAL